MTQISKSRLYFLLFLLLGVFSLTFFILRPFLYALLLASILAIVCQPWYKFCYRLSRRRAWLASWLTVLGVVIFILGPISFLGWQVFQEGESLYLSLVANGKTAWFDNLIANLDKDFSFLAPGLESLSFDFQQYLRSGLDVLLQNLGSAFFNLIKIFFNLFVFMFAFFYLLKDGQKLKEFFLKVSPLTPADDEAIINKVLLAINSVVKGSLTISVFQGITASIGFFIFGLPSPILWGTLATLGALIPGIGTAVVIAPAVLYLYLTGEAVSALGLLLWGMLAVGLIDNFLAPHLIGKKAKLHPLLTLLSVFGGLSFFGPIGFLLGPLIVSLLLVLLEIYGTIITRPVRTPSS